MTRRVLEPAALADLVARCAAAGLTIRDAAVSGVMLELVPADLDALPDADALYALAGALLATPPERGVRYVTLSLDEPAP
jgi:hypothetical protein